MLDSLYVKNFRLFKELQIPNFKRVNLFVGKNNSGKSCLLEAIYLLNKFQISDIAGFLRLRDETQYKDPFDNTSYINNLFNRDLKDLKELLIRGNDGEYLKISIDKVQGSYESDLLDKRPELLLNLLDKFTNNIDKSDLGLSNYIYNLPLIERKKIIYTSLTRRFPLNGTSFPQLWETIELTDFENDVIKALQIIEPDIDKVGLRTNGTPIVRLKNTNTVLPLRNFGEGMEHILSIILSLLNVQNGVLLIDEFENGLHWSVHNKLWEIIFELSEKLNIQVFVTSHSFDCIKGFSDVFTKNKDVATFYRLEKDKDNVLSTQYNYELLKNTIEFGVEFR